MKRSLVAVLAAAALPLAGCGSFYVEAEQPQVCLTLPARTFSVVLPTVSGSPITFSSDVHLALSDAIPDFVLSGTSKDHVLHFLGLSLTLESSSATTFAWLTDLAVTAQSGSQPAVELAHFTPGSQAAGVSLTLGSDAPDRNLTDFLAGGEIVVNVAGTIDPSRFPTGATSWTGSVRGCFSAQVRKTLQEITGG